MAHEAVIHALADPTRRSIFESLRDLPQTVGEIAAKQPVSRPAVSQHLKVLQEAELVSVRPQGTRRLYLIRPEGLASLQTYLNQFWSDVLTGYGAEVVRQVEAKTPSPPVAPPSESES